MEIMVGRVCTYENALTEQTIDTRSGEATCTCGGVEYVTEADLIDYLTD